jgi:hypothetical protein
MTKHTTEAGMLAEQGRAMPSARATGLRPQPATRSSRSSVPIAVDDGPFGQPGVCTLCGDDNPCVDEATELCEMCFEHVFGDDA